MIMDLIHETKNIRNVDEFMAFAEKVEAVNKHSRFSCTLCADWCKMKIDNHEFNLYGMRRMQSERIDNFFKFNDVFIGQLRAKYEEYKLFDKSEPERTRIISLCQEILNAWTELKNIRDDIHAVYINAKSSANIEIVCEYHDLELGKVKSLPKHISVPEWLQKMVNYSENPRTYLLVLADRLRNYNSDHAKRFRFRSLADNVKTLHDFMQLISEIEKVDKNHMVKLFNIMACPRLESSLPTHVWSLDLPNLKPTCAEETLLLWFMTDKKRAITDVKAKYEEVKLIAGDDTKQALFILDRCREIMSFISSDAATGARFSYSKNGDLIIDIRPKFVSRFSYSVGNCPEWLCIRLRNAESPKQYVSNLIETLTRMIGKSVEDDFVEIAPETPEKIETPAMLIEKKYKELIPAALELSASVKKLLDKFVTDMKFVSIVGDVVKFTNYDEDGEITRQDTLSLAGMTDRFKKKAREILMPYDLYQPNHRDEIEYRCAAEPYSYGLGKFSRLLKKYIDDLNTFTTGNPDCDTCTVKLPNFYIQRICGGKELTDSELIGPFASAQDASEFLMKSSGMWNMRIVYPICPKHYNGDGRPLNKLMNRAFGIAGLPTPDDRL